MPELITWAFSHGIFDEVGGIKTSDGAIVWDDSLIHDTSGDDGVWGDNLHRQSDPAAGESAAQVRYEARESKDETVSGIKEQIKRNAKALEAMEPVGSAMVSGIERMTIAQKRQWAETILRPTGYKVDRQGFGSIYFEPRHINQGLNYLKQDGEIAAFTMLPKVLKRGIVIESRENHKGRNFGTVTIAAPVEINGVRGNMAAVVQLTGKNHYHTHRIIMPDGSAFAFNAEKNTESKPAGALLQKSTHATPIESVSKHSIRSGNEKSNTKFSVRERFPDELDRWEKDGMPEGVEFTLGSTGPVLQGLGAIESDIYMSGDKIRTILDPDAQHPHLEMTAAEIKKIPQILEDPVLVLKSRGRGMRGENSRLAVFGLIKAKNGQPVMAVMDLRPREDGFLVDDMQKVNSAYTKDNAADFIRGSDVLFADKKRTIPLLRMTGLTIASQQLLRNGYVGSIAYSGQRVKIEGVPFSSVVQEGDTRFSIREAKITDRELLANALETTARNDLERGLLAQYQEKAKSAAQWERWLDYHRQKLADHESGAHPLTTQQVLLAREKAAQYAEKLDQLDEKLLKIESMGPMRKLLERERHRRTRVVGTFPDSNSAGTCKQFCA